MTRVWWAASACVPLLLLGGCGNGPVDAAPSKASLPLLTQGQLDRALLTARTVGASYARQDAQPPSPPRSLGCLDALEPNLLGADMTGPTARALVEYATPAALPMSSVTSAVISFSSERDVAQALDDFSVTAGACTEVSESVGGVGTTLTVTSRLVPVKAPVDREVLVTGRGNTGNGVITSAVGRMVKVGRIGNHLLAVETTAVGAYAPDITPYFNNARARLIAVIAGDDPGPGRPVR